MPLLLSLSLLARPFSLPLYKYIDRSQGYHHFSFSSSLTTLSLSLPDTPHLVPLSYNTLRPPPPPPPVDTITITNDVIASNCKMKRQSNHHVALRTMPAPTYRGDHFAPGNQSADIPDEENTSIYMDRLPATLNYPTLFAALHKTGTVKQCHIGPPDQKNPLTCNVKLIYFAHEDAAAVLKAAKAGAFKIAGIVPRTCWNRVKVPEQNPGNKTRCLRIKGQSWLANQAVLECIWSLHGLWWNAKKVLDLGEVADGISIVHYNFGSWRCQANKAKKILETSFPGVLEVTYRADPCTK
ncbi:hypothetical protein F5Y16DRAFT_108771 [Xylariaceae sp. FL0255]|nr:hypothetical protein F5Y16DRAFT_108771 [Xylariaceae sp. FL0255]